MIADTKTMQFLQIPMQLLPLLLQLLLFYITNYKCWGASIPAPVATAGAAVKASNNDDDDGSNLLKTDVETKKNLLNPILLAYFQHYGVRSLNMIKCLSNKTTTATTTSGKKKKKIILCFGKI